MSELTPKELEIIRTLEYGEKNKVLIYSLLILIVIAGFMVITSSGDPHRLQAGLGSIL